MPAALFSKTLVRKRPSFNNAQSNLRLAMSTPNTIISDSMDDELTMAAHCFSVRYSYTSRLTAHGSAYDTVQLHRAQKNGGRLILAPESGLLDAQPVSFLRRASPFASLTPAHENI